MSRALVFTDLHIHDHKGEAKRLQDCLKVLEWVLKIAINEQIDHVFFLGDLFHERSKIDVLNYLRTFEVFMKYMPQYDGDVNLLIGNHDLYYKERWDVNSVRPFSAISGINIIQEPTQIIIGDRKIDWMPHTDNPIKELDALKKKNGGAGDILLGHMAVHGATLNTYFGTRADVIVEYDNEIMPVDLSIFDDWQMTLLGHYHAAQNLNEKVEYIGSPLQLSYGEAFQQKHVLILDLDTLKKTYVVNDFSPKHLLITPQDIENECYDLNSNFVRIVVSDIANKDLIDLKRKIAKEYKVLSLDLKQKDKKLGEDDETVVEDAKSILEDTGSMLDRYIKDKGVPQGLEENHLKLVGQKCLAQISS